MKAKFILFTSAVMMSATAFAQQYVTTGGQKYVLLEESTGAWCQYCPDGAVVVEEVLANEPKAIAVSIHNNDAMSFSDGDIVTKAFFTGFPLGTVDRTKGSNGTIQKRRGSWSDSVQINLQNTPKFDIVMSHSYDKATRELKVHVEATALEDLTGDYNFNVFVSEDSVIGSGTGYDQVNAYNNQSGHPYHNAGNPIKGFVHMQVLRAMLGGAWGTTGVITKDPKKGAKFSKDYTYSVPSENDDKNMRLVGLVQAQSTISTQRPIINSIGAKVLPWTTSISNVTTNVAELQVYPNPATNAINVRAMLNKPANTTVTITNVLGQTVFSQEYKAGGSIFGETISTDNMANGVYYVSVVSEGTKTTERIVVSK